VSFCQKLAHCWHATFALTPHFGTLLERCRYALEQEKLRQKLTSKSDFLARRGAAWLLKDWGWRSRPRRLVGLEAHLYNDVEQGDPKKRVKQTGVK